MSVVDPGEVDVRSVNHSTAQKRKQHAREYLLMLSKRQRAFQQHHQSQSQLVPPQPG